MTSAVRFKFTALRFFCFSGYRTPSCQHEYFRQKLETGVKEFWNYFNFQLQDLKSAFQSEWTDLTSRVDNMVLFGAEQYRYSVL